VLRAQAGVADAPDLVEAIGAFSLDQVDTLAEALLSAPPTPSGDVGAGKMWPLVNARASLMSGTGQSLAASPAPAGLNLMAAMNPRDIGKSTFSASVPAATLPNVPLDAGVWWTDRATELEHSHSPRITVAPVEASSCLVTGAHRIRLPTAKGSLDRR
jgi:hypothetical protein